MFRLAWPVNKRVFPKELGTAREGCIPGMCSRDLMSAGAHKQAAHGPFRPASYKSIPPPFLPTAPCIACSAAASAAPVFLGRVKALLRVGRCTENASDQGCPYVQEVSNNSKPLLGQSSVHLLHLRTPFSLKGQVIKEGWQACWQVLVTDQHVASHSPICTPCCSKFLLKHLHLQQKVWALEAGSNLQPSSPAWLCDKSDSCCSSCVKAGKGFGGPSGSAVGSGVQYIEDFIFSQTARDYSA